MVEEEALHANFSVDDTITTFYRRYEWGERRLLDTVEWRYTVDMAKAIAMSVIWSNNLDQYPAGGFRSSTMSLDDYLTIYDLYQFTNDFFFRQRVNLIKLT